MTRIFQEAGLPETFTPALSVNCKPHAKSKPQLNLWISVLICGHAFVRIYLIWLLWRFVPGSGNVKAIQLHYLGPDGYKFVDKLLLGVCAGIDFR
jgi:hypothetical protein